MGPQYDSWDRPLWGEMDHREELELTILAPLDQKLAASWVAALTEAEDKYRIFVQAMVQHSYDKKLNVLKQFEISAYNAFNLVKAVGTALAQTLAYGYYAASELPKSEIEISLKLSDVMEKLHSALLLTTKIYPLRLKNIV
uniref:Uncharacterized protein n=1 Tax=Strigamia maritima TaxID=126957 RepID=T1IRG0_STRMM